MSSASPLSRLLCRIGLAAIVILPIGRLANAADPVGKPAIYKTVDGRDLKLYVLQPEDARSGDNRPAIVFFHGGGWVGGAPTQFNLHAEHFAKRGLVCVQVEYRLLDKVAKDPPTCCIEDARSAMRWVRSHAGELGIDPHRMASAGGSAGGHLAACVGMMDGHDAPGDDKTVSPRSNAMLLFNPVFNNGPEGWGHQRVGDRYREFSPAHNISADDPPAIVFLGSEDKLIPIKVVENFEAEMTKAGVRCETRIYEGQGHGFFNARGGDNRYYRETLGEADAFLVSLGWLPDASK
jgi:acetyl esterase